MSVKQNLYQIFKLSSDWIVEHNCNIESYSKVQASKDGTLVAIGDNLVFHQIRKYYNDNRTHLEIFSEIQNLRRTLKKCKKENRTREARIIDRRITDILFVKDIVNVKVEKKSSYKEILKKGFTLNGIKYCRFLAGAGQIRRNTVTFINEELYSTLYENLMCDLNHRTNEFNLAKLSAYFALSFSSILWVRNPRVVVIKDFFNILHGQKVDFITKDKNGNSVIEERIMDIELNCADGQGLIDPEFSKLWAEDMEIGYVPSSFVVRSCFVKGNLVPFDFKEYAKQNEINCIIDKWGIKHNIEEVDVILSESQFKMHKYYKSWEEYKYYADKADIKWGVARYNRKYDEEYVLANYQYIQALDLTKEDIQHLITPTIDYLNNICSGDRLYALLYMFGCSGEDMTQEKLLSKAQSLAAKAVVKNNKMLEDTYIQAKIYKNIAESINKSKIGKIWVRGNYQFMISDPLAQCRSALGMSLKGEIPADSVYSNFWNTKNENIKVLDLCRSPMIDTHEHNPCNLYNSPEAEYWYQYIKSGIIFNIYDTSTFRHSDSDFDGDLCLSSDNPYFIKGSHKEQNIITYEKGVAKSQKISIKNFGKTDIRGLGTGVGGFSNIATILYSMKGLFYKDTQQDQKAEITKRIKLLREIVGQEIDRIKGTAAPSLPSEWKKMIQVNEDDTDVIKASKYKHNSMVIGEKKPYFFRYLYPYLNQHYKQYEDCYNQVSSSCFGIKIKKLITKQNKTEEEMNLIRRYNKFSPLITAPCNMNILCREIENIDFNIKYNKHTKSCLPTFEDKFVFDKNKMDQVKKLYQRYNNTKYTKILGSFFSYDEYQGCNSDFIKDIKFGILDTVKNNIVLEYEALNISGEEFLYYVYQISQSYSKFNWNFPWDILGEGIINLIPEGESFVPIRNIQGREFLGEKYILTETNKNLYNSYFTEVNILLNEDTNLEEMFLNNIIFEEE